MRPLSEIRHDIDSIDIKIRELLMKRLDLSGEVVLSKIEDKNYIINRPERENEMIQRLSGPIPDDRRPEYRALLRKITETSRMYQYGILYEEVPELFSELIGNENLKKTELITVYLKRPDEPNAMSAILSMIGDYGFDMEILRLLSYEDSHRTCSFSLTIRGDIRNTNMQKLLLELSMESIGFRIEECR